MRSSRAGSRDYAGVFAGAAVVASSASVADQPATRWDGRWSVVRLGVSLALNTSKQDPLRGASSAPDPGRTDLVGPGVRVTSVPASVLHAKADGPESLLEWQLHF